jgi:transmembrane 9 superfamily protein 2/4
MAFKKPRAGMLLLLAAAAQSMRIPTTLQANDPLRIVMGPLRSPYRAIPLSYLVDDLFCRPSSTVPLSRTFGESMSGGELILSPLDVHLGKTMTCSVICTKNLTARQKARLISLIDSDYRYSMSLDGLPVTATSLGRDDAPQVMEGFDVGYVQSGLHYLYNFFKFTISTANVSTGFQITNFQLSRASSATMCSGGKKVCIEEANSVTFRFSAVFSHANWTRIATVDKVEMSPESSIFCIILSLIAGAVLALHALRRNPPRAGFEFDEYDGSEWKLVHGDIFRPPPDAGGLAARVGLGAQLLISAVVLLAFRPLDTLSSLLTAVPPAVCAAGFFGGLIGGGLFKTIGQDGWRSFLIQIPLRLSVAVAALMAAVYIAGLRNSSVDFPVAPLAGWLFLNFIVTVVGVLLGLAFRRPDVRINQIPRAIPQQGLLQSPWLHATVAGVFLYVAPAGQLHILTVASWLGGVTVTRSSGLLWGLAALVVLAMLVGVVLTFARLAAEDYRWWWPAYRSASWAGAGYLIYSVYFIAVEWGISDSKSVLVFLCVSVGVALALAVVIGASAFVGAFAFVQIMYGLLKME